MENVSAPTLVRFLRRRMAGGAGFSRERIEEEIKQGGTEPMWRVPRCRVRYFTDGVVLGSKAFVDGFFERKNSKMRW